MSNALTINQWIPAAHRGDAVGDNARAVRDFLRRQGHNSDIYAMTIDDNMAGEAVLMFKEALKIDPTHAGARHNLPIATRAARDAELRQPARTS